MSTALHFGRLQLWVELLLDQLEADLRANNPENEMPPAPVLAEPGASAEAKPEPK